MGSDASQPTRRGMIKTGAYTGNGADDRNIDIGIDLTVKNNVYVIIYAVSATWSFHRPEQGQGDLTKPYTNGAEITNIVQTMTNTGFQVGNGDVNANGVVIRYIVFWEEP